MKLDKFSIVEQRMAIALSAARSAIAQIVYETQAADATNGEGSADYRSSEISPGSRTGLHQRLGILEEFLRQRTS